MRKKIGYLSRCVAVCSAFFFVQQPIRSQVSNPSTWESFVQSGSNISIRDTFRMQTFEGLATDNWTYETTGEASIADLSEVTEIPGKHGRYGLRMSLGSRVAFEHFSLSNYQDVKISVHKGGILLSAGEEMYAKTYREGETQGPSLVNGINATTGITAFLATAITRNPPGVDLIVPAPVADSQHGCYYVDSVHAHGMIPTYSLFTGSGDWNDTVRWSHLPAYRRRKALVNGDVSVGTRVCCEEILIGNGTIRIAPAGSLSVNNLSVYSDNTASASSAGLRSSGDLHVAGTMAVEKTFAQKDKWYFVSFPFDVYASGIDPDFQLGDDKSDTNGNYLYIQTYNGDKRASSQSLSNNWEVMPRTTINSALPIFKKNKGYLIAIDASADRQTLRFTSKEGDIPNDLGKNGQAPIQITVNTQSASQDHNGWYLCGNPLPAPLPLDQIEADPALDGYVYLYDGSTYQAYAIGSDFALPPFSAFFVKASKNTSLIVRGTSEPASYKLLPAGAPLSSLKSEPRARQESPVSNQSLSLPGLRCRLENKALFIDDLPSAGKVELFTPEGRLAFAREVRAGSSVLPIPLSPGVYILIVRTKQDQARRKCVVAP